MSVQYYTAMLFYSKYIEFCCLKLELMMRQKKNRNRSSFIMWKVHTEQLLC